MRTSAIMKRAFLGIQRECGGDRQFARADYSNGAENANVLNTMSQTTRAWLPFPGRDAAFFMPLRRTGIVPNIVLVTAPALQRTTPLKKRRAALRPGNGVPLSN